MKIEEFNNLKVGDFVPVLHGKNSLNYDISQVTEINRTTKRISVVGHNKSYSYKTVKSKNWKLTHGAGYRNIGYLGVAYKYDVVEKMVAAKCSHKKISDRGFIYPNYTCMDCGEQFGEIYPKKRLVA